MPALLSSQEEGYTAADAEVIELTDDKEREKLRADPLYRLEHGEKAKVKVSADVQQCTTDVQQMYNNHIAVRLSRKVSGPDHGPHKVVHTKHMMFHTIYDEDLIPSPDPPLLMTRLNCSRQDLQRRPSRISSRSTTRYIEMTTQQTSYSGGLKPVAGRRAGTRCAS